MDLFTKAIKTDLLAYKDRVADNIEDCECVDDLVQPVLEIAHGLQESGTVPRTEQTFQNLLMIMQHLCDRDVQTWVDVVCFVTKRGGWNDDRLSQVLLAYMDDESDDYQFALDSMKKKNPAAPKPLRFQFRFCSAIKSNGKPCAQTKIRANGRCAFHADYVAKPGAKQIFMCGTVKRNGKPCQQTELVKKNMRCKYHQ